AREHPLQVLRNLQPAEANTATQVTIHELSEVGELINHQHVNLWALVAVNVLLILAMAQVNLGAVEGEDDLIGAIVDARKAFLHPRREHVGEGGWPLHVILVEVGELATEEIDLQAINLRAPANRCATHQM